MHILYSLYLRVGTYCLTRMSTCTYILYSSYLRVLTVWLIGVHVHMYILYSLYLRVLTIWLVWLHKQTVCTLYTYEYLLFESYEFMYILNSWYLWVRMSYLNGIHTVLFILSRYCMYVCMYVHSLAGWHSFSMSFVRSISKWAITVIGRMRLLIIITGRSLGPAN